jgi:hypothetical protein
MMCNIVWGFFVLYTEQTNNIMATFILGYEDFTTMDLIEYDTQEDASYNSEEWCTVEAETLEEAKELYDVQFNAHKEAGRINGSI